MSPAQFEDRIHAGRLLAEELVKYADRDDLVVLALPRGGVPVAYEVAQRLHAPLDVLVVRKLGLPDWEELAIGAIASGGVRVVNDDVVNSLRISPEEIEAVAARELKELRRREIAYRGHPGVPVIEEMTVILVDDGIATGSTILAAVQALRQFEPRKIIIAVPVASSEARAQLGPMVDEFVALVVPDEFRSVSHWYQDFSQTTDQEVTQLLAKAAKNRPSPQAR